MLTALFKFVPASVSLVILVEAYDFVFLIDAFIAGGGWINLDKESQFMSCIPGSHLGVRLKGLKSGFATIGKKDIDKFKPYKQLFEIKPGHCIIFPQYLLHKTKNCNVMNDVIIFLEHLLILLFLIKFVPLMPHLSSISYIGFPSINVSYLKF